MAASLASLLSMVIVSGSPFQRMAFFEKPQCRLFISMLGQQAEYTKKVPYRLIPFVW
jgi:hypothetical protein